MYTPGTLLNGHAAMGGLGGCGTAAKYILIIVNFIIWAGGAVLLGVGLYYKITGEGLNYFEIINIAGDDPLWDFALWIIIVLGAVLFVIGFLGCCGAFWENAPLLLIYAILIIIIVLAEITAGVLAIVYREEIEKVLRDGMLQQVKEEYKDETDQDVLTQTWNALQVEFECCGTNDYKDWWGSQFDYYMNGSSDDPLYRRVPIVCCRLQDLDVNNPQPVNITYCIREAYDNTGDITPWALNPGGCYEQLWSWVDEVSFILIGIAFGVAFTEIIVIVSAFIVRQKTIVNQGVIY